MKYAPRKFSNLCLRRSAGIVLLAGAVWFGLAPASRASDPADDQQAATPAKPAATTTTTTTPAAPPKPQWAGKLSGGVQYESGRTHSNGLTLSGDLAKAVSKSDTIAFDGILTYATYRVVPLARTTATNNSWFGAQELHRLNNRFFLVDRAMFNRDTVVGISHREINAMGVGVNLFLSPRGQLYVVPAYGVGNQNTRVREINGFTTGFVSYQKFAYKLNDMWSVSQYSMWRTSTKNSHDMSIKAYAGLDAPALYKRLFLSIGLDYNYEGMISPLIPGNTKNDAVLGFKFNYRIGK
jgi:hypothetical protein